MPNRPHGQLGVIEDSMARVAAARLAVLDLEGLMMRMAQTPSTRPDDLDRMSKDLPVIEAGLLAIRKHLIDLRGVD